MRDTPPETCSETVQPPADSLGFNRQMMTRLGEMLRLYRAVHGLSLRDCAQEIGVHFTTLARFERNNAGMSAEHLLKILNWILGPPAGPRRYKA